MKPSRIKVRKCEWDIRCKRKVKFRAFHWGKTFDLCAPCEKDARKHYQTEKI